MIIDRSALAGEASYLLADGGGLNLAAATSRASTRPVPEGQSLQISSLTVVLEHHDLSTLLPCREQALFTIGMRKEIFPGFSTDPYAHRVHRIAGFDDLGQGVMSHFRAMDIEGRAALVSTDVGAPCRWTSMTYRMPAPAPIEAVAWEMPMSRLTPEAAFTYSVRLRYWTAADDVGQPPPHQANLLTDGTAASPRFAALASAVKATAYLVEFDATVTQDGAIEERHARGGRLALGRPMLTAVHLIEPVASTFAFRSLAELLDHAAWFQIFNSADGVPVRLVAQLSFTAVLTEGESVFLEGVDAAAALTRLEARIAAEVQVRPPRAAVED